MMFQLKMVRQLFSWLKNFYTDFFSHFISKRSLNLQKSQLNTVVCFKKKIQNYSACVFFLESRFCEEQLRSEQFEVNQFNALVFIAANQAFIHTNPAGVKVITAISSQCMVKKVKTNNPYRSIVVVVLNPKNVRSKILTIDSTETEQ